MNYSILYFKYYEVHAKKIKQPNVHFRFSGRYWSHIQDFRDLFKRTFIIVWRPSFPTFTCFWKSWMLRCEKLYVSKMFPYFFYVLKYFHIKTKRWKGRSVIDLSILGKFQQLSKMYWNIPQAVIRHLNAIINHKNPRNTRNNAKQTKRRLIFPYRTVYLASVTTPNWELFSYQWIGKSQSFT